MLPELISVASLGLEIYKTVSGVRSGKEQLATALARLEKAHERVEKLADRILYVPTSYAVIDTARASQQTITDSRAVRAALEPIQRTLGDTILSSAMIAVPELMQKALTANPWAVLVNVQPIAHARPPLDADLVPITFDHKNERFVGWQKVGALPMLLNCEYRGYGAVTGGYSPSPPLVRAFKQGDKLHLIVGAHELIIRDHNLGTFSVAYDGRELTKHWSLGSQEHELVVEEDGLAVHYRVRISLGKVTVSRDGVTLHDRRYMSWI
jgi:hypothetical protein